MLDGWNNMKPTPIGNEHFDIYVELDGNNQLIARYLHGDGFDQTFARVDLRAANASERVLWYLTDHLNSVRLVLDESGAVLDQIAYDAFGNIVAQLNPLLVNPILFASREFDAETGLYYNRARYLDPTTGRWTTQDPLGFAAGDANLYRYVFNAPTVFTDPSGQIVPFLLVGGVVLTLGGIGGLHYAASRYDYAVNHYLSRPIHEWTPELQAEFRDYVQTTDWIAVGTEFAGWTRIVLVGAGLLGGTKPVLGGPWLGAIAVHGPHHKFWLIGRAYHVQMMIRMGAHVTSHIRIPFWPG